MKLQYVISNRLLIRIGKNPRLVTPLVGLL